MICFNLISERYIHSYTMNPETNNIHAFIKIMVFGKDTDFKFMYNNKVLEKATPLKSSI